MNRRPPRRRNGRRSAPAVPAGDGVRLHKFIADAGLASRREAERLIASGHVKVNGVRVTEMGVRIDPARDLVHVDGEHVRPDAGESPVWVMLYKPPQTITSRNDPEGRPTVYESLSPYPDTLRYVGRLDWDAEGLLLFTNDGFAAAALTRPAGHVAKVYRIKIDGLLTDDDVERLRSGIRLDDGYRCRPAEVERVRRLDGKEWIDLVLTEGKTHQVKRMIAALGHSVVRIVRIQFGPVELDLERPGDKRELTGEEVMALYELVPDSPRAVVESEPERAGAAAPAPQPARSGARRRRPRA